MIKSGCMDAEKDNKVIEKHAGGRPTTYKPEYCKMIIEYFDVDPTKVVETKYTNKKGETWTKDEIVANALRFLSMFAYSIGSNPQRLLEWCKEFPEFQEAYTQAKELQKQHLIECGLLGLFNSKFAIFTAKNITTMRDKVEVDHGIQPETAQLLGLIDGESKGKLPSREEAESEAAQ